MELIAIYWIGVLLIGALMIWANHPADAVFTVAFLWPIILPIGLFLYFQDKIERVRNSR